jgi:molybdopterin molybdotransferase
VGDNRKDLEEAITKAAAECDIVVTTGGVSMGDFDYVIESAERAGFSILFTKVAQRPGKPMVGGIRDRVLFFGLPGNPVSVMVCFEVFARPAIRKILGHRQLFRPTIKGSFEEPFSKVKGLHFWSRVVIAGKEKQFLLRPSANQRSDILRSMVFGNGLAEIPVDVETVEAGEPVTVHLLDDGGEFIFGKEPE